jgi:hypothetical protein
LFVEEQNSFREEIVCRWLLCPKIINGQKHKIRFRNTPSFRRLQKAFDKINRTS